VTQSVTQRWVKKKIQGFFFFLTVHCYNKHSFFLIQGWLSSGQTSTS